MTDQMRLAIEALQDVCEQHDMVISYTLGDQMIIWINFDDEMEDHEVEGIDADCLKEELEK